MMSGFENSLSELVNKAAPSSIHEIGCGEGYWVVRWNELGFVARGCDFSKKIIQIAQDNAESKGLSRSLFRSRSIYDLDQEQDGADLVVCCEVLEHLEDPEEGLAALRGLASRHVILSVPREPLWRVLNMSRGKYITDFGNTPGHIQHWNSTRFIKLVSRYFNVVEVRNPLPWTMLLCGPKND